MKGSGFEALNKTINNPPIMVQIDQMIYFVLFYVIRVNCSDSSNFSKSVTPMVHFQIFAHLNLFPDGEY